MLGVLQYSGECTLCAMVWPHHVQELHPRTSMGRHQSSNRANPASIHCLLPLVQSPITSHNLQGQPYIPT
jgi:hypothetical protein